MTFDMHFLILSVLCSVLVSVLLKLAQRRRLAMPTILFWNYAVAVLLCAWLLDPPLARLHDAGTPWPSLLLLAVMLPSIFLAMAASVKAAGIVRTDVAQRLSLVVSLLAAFLWFGESADTVKLLGLGLGVLAIPAIVSRSRGASDGGTRDVWWLPLIVLLGYAGVDILLKHIAAAGTPFSASLFVAFGGALLIMLCVQVVGQVRGKLRLDGASLVFGVLVGASNFANILFYVKAHRALPDNPAVVFATMNLGVVVLGTLVGVLAFREKLARLNIIGIVLAVVAVATIAASLAWH
ncbi:MAG TPA: EamA family transporter [Pseudoxanthomonas sp.]|nr:EamA family transporter [Pseudoxanthomonas sp.]